MEVCIAGRCADSFRIIGVEATADLGINVPQCGVLTKSLHASAVDRISPRLEAGLDHGFSRMTMRRTHALAETVIERVIQVENHAANQRALCGETSDGLCRLAWVQAAIVIAVTIGSWSASCCWFPGSWWSY